MLFFDENLIEQLLAVWMSYVKTQEERLWQELGINEFYSENSHFNNNIRNSLSKLPLILSAEIYKFFYLKVGTSKRQTNKKTKGPKKKKIIRLKCI